jgi:site-specific DNA recombinase
MKLAAIYSRVSTDEQAKGYSLQTQVDACYAYADERRYQVVGTFSDDYTGAAIDRPALNQLRDYMSNNPLDVVIVYDIDRLARKSAYQFLIEEEFRRIGVVLEFVMAQYDDSDEGRLQKQLRGVIAEYEKAKIMERSKRGKRGKALSGYVLPGARPPYGYRVKSEPHKAWLVIDEDEAAVVRTVYDWYLYGDEKGVPLSTNRIAKMLTRMGVPTRGDKESHVFKKLGKGVWQPAMIVHILTNETYIGSWHFGKTKMIDDGKHREPQPKRGMGKQVPRAPEEWIPVEVPQIIDPDTFARVQIMKEEKKKILSGHTEYNYLMKGRLRCVKCGYAMSGHTVRKKNQYYRCKGKDQVIGLCDMPYFRIDLVDNIVWEWAKMIIQSPENLRGGLDRVQQELQQENHALLDRLAMIEEQMNKYQSQLDRLLDLYLSGEFEREVLTERKTRLEELLFNLGTEHNDLMSHVKHVTMTDDKLAYIEEFCAKIRTGLDHADFNAKRQIIQLLDIRGKAAFENGERVLYLKCLIEPPEQQLVSRVLISPSSNTGATATTACGSR